MLGATFFVSVYLNVPSIVTVHTEESTPVAGISLCLNCGLLNAISAIVYFFCPNIIELSTSLTKPAYNSCDSFSIPFSNGLVKNKFAFKPLL